jgi:hypothetical protein
MIGPVSVERWILSGAVACLLAGFATGATAAGRVDPSFTPGPAFAGYLLAVDDFNRDGRSDLAIGNRSKLITILLGNGTGGLSAAPGPGIKVGQPRSAATADFNGDGKSDLAVVVDRSNTVAVLLGNGAGSFDAAPGPALKVPASLDEITAADLNADGFADLAVTLYDEPTWRIAILLGDGAGRFTPAPASPIRASKQFTAFAVGDFNGDGKPDLALTDLGSNKVSILLGVGGGEFRAGGTVVAAKEPSCLVIADMNADGKLDLAVGAYSHNLTVLLGNGAGGFHVAAGSPIGIGSLFEPGSGYDPADIATADLNRDGKPDLAVANEDSNTVVVLLGKGDGRFRPAAYSPFPLRSPYSLRAADLNGDGNVDLAVSGAGLTILWQTPSAPVVVSGRALPGRPDALMSTRWPVTKLAADANRVAAKTAELKKECSEQAVVWTPPSHESKSFKTDGDCSYACGNTKVCVELALGAGRVAWIARTGGNSLDLNVVAAKLTGGAPKDIDYANNGNGAASDPDGDYVGQLFGGGSLLVFNRWTVCDPHNPESPGKTCPRRDPATGLAKEKLVRVVDGRRVVLKTGASSYRLVAVGGRRMAVEAASSALTILGPSGARVARVPALVSDPPRAVVLSRTHLAVERTFTLDLYRPTSGRTTKSLQLGPAAAFTLAGVNAKLALLRGPGRLVLLRLSDGKLISIPLSPAAANSLVDARLTDAGLFYAYNALKAKMKGRIVFEPVTKLLARF